MSKLHAKTVHKSSLASDVIRVARCGPPASVLAPPGLRRSMPNCRPRHRRLQLSQIGTARHRAACRRWHNVHGSDHKKSALAVGCLGRTRSRAPGGFWVHRDPVAPHGDLSLSISPPVSICIRVDFCPGGFCLWEWQPLVVTVVKCQFCSMYIVVSYRSSSAAW